MKRLAVAVMAALTCAHSAMAQDIPGNAEDVVWARPGGQELQARIYWPESLSGPPMATVIDVHGGAWSAGGRADGALYDQRLAEAGFLVIAIEFRDGPEFQHPTASADVTAAVRWVRLNAARLNADPEKIGLIGSSSGGHLAMLAALRPNAAAHLGTPIRSMEGAANAFAAHDEIDAGVDYVVAMWPVSDPQARFRYATRAGIGGLLGGHENYFHSDEAAMLDASIPAIVTSGAAGVGDALPPLLLIQAGMDSNVPQDMTLDLLRAYQSRDGKIEYAFYPGMAHAFGHRPSPETGDLMGVVADFIRRRSR